MKFKMMLAVAAILTICLSPAAYANNTITFTLTNPNGFVWSAAGGTLTFQATVSAPVSNSDSLFFNGDSFNVTAPFTLDDTDFGLNFFPVDLAPGTSFTGDLFQLTVPAGMAFGDYAGSFTLLGGADFNALDSLGTVNFSVAAVPEPSSVMLLLSGIAGLGWLGFKPNFRGRLS